MSFLGKRFDSSIEILNIIIDKKDISPISSKEISEKTTLSLRYIEMIIKDLVKAKILKSIRGAKGGYLLANDRRKILLSDIYKAGEYDLINENKDKMSSIYPYSSKIILDLNDDCLKKVMKNLSEVTLEDIYIQHQKIKSSSNKKTTSSDFVI